jgi:hypothetical protein
MFVLICVLGVATTAFATTNLFTPISWAAFSAVYTADEQFIDKGVHGITNHDPANPHYVAASLGHAMGGSNSFVFYGVNNHYCSPTVVCTVYVTLPDGSVYDYTNTTSAHGPFTMYVGTSPASGDAFYTAWCNIPASCYGDQTYIIGVKPNS